MATAQITNSRHFHFAHDISTLRVLNTVIHYNIPENLGSFFLPFITSNS